MTMTTMPVSALARPQIPRLYGVHPNPASVTHPGLKQITERLHAAWAAQRHAIEETNRLASQHLDAKAEQADRAALAAAVGPKGYQDPGCPATTQLRADREAAHRKLYALTKHVEGLISEWLDYLRTNFDEISAYLHGPRDEAAGKVAAALVKTLPEVNVVQKYDAELEWLDRAAHTEPAFDSRFSVTPSPHVTLSPMLATVEALLDTLRGNQTGDHQ